MAYDEGLRSISLAADATIAGYTGVPGLPGSADPNGGKQYKFVKVTGAKTCGLATGASKEVVIGVLQNKPQVTGQAATVAIRGVSRVVAGGAVDAGTTVTVNSDGEAEETTDNELVVGVAVTSGADQEIISVLLATPANIKATA